MRNPRLGLLLFAFASSLAACNAAVDPIDVDVGCPDKPLRGPQEWAAAAPEAVIDDFEDGDLSLFEVAGRSGNWYPFPTWRRWPRARPPRSAPPTASGPGTSSPPATAAGSNWNASMIDPFTAVIPYDASAWSGFSFWIAAHLRRRGRHEATR